MWYLCVVPLQQVGESGKWKKVVAAVAVFAVGAAVSGESRFRSSDMSAQQIRVGRQKHGVFCGFSVSLSQFSGLAD